MTDAGTRLDDAAAVQIDGIRTNATPMERERLLRAYSAALDEWLQSGVDLSCSSFEQRATEAPSTTQPR